MDYTVYLHDSGILEWKINRPEKRNAINFNVIHGLEKVLEIAEDDPKVKAFVITGEGEAAFCSGGDLDEFHLLKTKEDAYAMLSKMGKILFRLATLDKPTLALINGTAVGGGCELAAACDFRIAKKGSKLGFIQGNLGITTGWGGASLLFERIPVHSALKMLMEAKTYYAEELIEEGFIQFVFSEVNSDSAHQFFKEMIMKDVNVLKCYKQSIISKWEENHLQERMNQEIRNCAVLWERDTHHQAVEKFRNK